MAKPKPSAKDLNEAAKEEQSDRTVSNVIGGVTKKQLMTCVDRRESIDAKMSELKGDMSAIMTAFDEQGGNKGALKLAIKLKNMETDKAKDFWSCLEAYMEELGVFAQLELFADDIQVGPAEAVAAKPVGLAQAEAYSAAHAH